MAKKYTSTTAAKLTGLSLRRILQYCQSENVEKFGGVYVLSDSHLKDLEKRRRPCQSNQAK
jgi:hypothetical protein